MKRTIATTALACIVALILAADAGAQALSFTAPEIRRLRKELKADSAAAEIFEGFRRTASRAVNDVPNPIANIRSQGLLQGDPIKTASLKAVEDVWKMHALALVYRVDGKKAYLPKVREFLLAWARENKASGGPIDETKLEEAFIAYDLVRADLSKNDRQVIDAWLESIATAELNSAYAAEPRSTARNNWNSHRIKVIVQIAKAIHTTKFDSAIAAELDKQFLRNLNPDGTSFDFHERDALHYHIYTLEPLLKAFIALNRADGRNYFDYQTPQGASVKRSVDFLVPFVTREKEHIEFANSKVAFDRARASNGEKGYQPAAFVPSRGIIVLALADYFDPSYGTLIAKVGDRYQNYLDWQLLMNRVRKPVN
jgi:hypothetical protein